MPARCYRSRAPSQPTIDFPLTPPVLPFTPMSPLRSALPVCLFFLAGCASAPRAKQAEPVGAEVRSILGEPLPPPQLPPDRRAALEADLEEARAAYRADPDSEAAAIWVGRRLAYLGRFREAVEWYTREIEAHPESHRLLRHRGHRWITLRELDRAVADLSRASELMLHVPDVIEPDGQPNSAGIPRTTDRFNIWYHLGLAHYLRGDYVAAESAWRSCLAVSRANDDMLVPTTYWLTLALLRLGRVEETLALLGPIHRGMYVLESSSYLALLLHFRGEQDAGQMAERAAPGSTDRATLSYGIAAWDLAHGERERAEALLEALVAEPTWTPFGHIAAEADLARMRGIGK